MDQCKPKVGNEYLDLIALLRGLSPIWKSVRGMQVPIDSEESEAAPSAEPVPRNAGKEAVVLEAASSALTRLLCGSWFAFLQFVLLLYL